MPRLERWLSSPRILWIALAAAILVALPGLSAHPIADQFLTTGVLQGRPAPVPPPSTPWSLYRYTAASAPAMELSIAKGIYPWWTLPELKLAFFRPLSSALMVLDHALFGGNLLGAHLHSLLWYLGLLAIVAALLRRVLPGPIGAVALLFYAVSDKHADVLSSVMARHMLIAGACGFLGLLFHVCWREQGRRRFLPLSLLAFGLALAGGEAALSVFAYLIMYEVLGAPGTARTRLGALVPAGILLAAWGVAYQALGYGCSGSDFFVSPVDQPLPWLRELPLRVPVLLGALLLDVPADLSWGADMPRYAAVGLVSLAIVGALLRVSWGSLTVEERRHVRWLLAGALLALPTVAVLPPVNRVLLVPNLGAAVAVAVPIVPLLRAASRSSWRFGVTALGAGLLGLIHLVVSPWLLLASVSLIDRIGRRADDIQQVLAEEMDQARLPGQRVVVLAVPSPLYGLYTSTQWWATGHPLPQTWMTLSLSSEVHRVTRTDPATIEMELLEGRFFTEDMERVHRGGHFPLATGARVPLDGITAEVVEVDAEGVRKLRFVFDVPLDDPSLVLLTWKDRALRRWSPPPVGASIEINRVVQAK